MFSFSGILLVTLPLLLPFSGLWNRLSDKRRASLGVSDNFHHKSYDYIVVGAGSAGCAVAARLSEDDTATVLLLEAGGSESIVSEIPQTPIMLQGTPMDWQYKTVPQRWACYGLKGRRSVWPRGKVLGGCSAINYMMYVRGNRHDFDRWEYEYGARGWSYKDVLPYFKRAENNLDKDIAKDRWHHSVGGPLSVRRGSTHSVLAGAFLKAAKYFGYSVHDINGFNQVGFTIPQATITKEGHRCSSARAYLEPIKKRRNLHVLTFAHVTRVLINGYNEAYGVEFDHFGERQHVFARREVILSAGSVNSAQLLMLSGVGPRRHLEKFGIKVRADLPVGRNLQDHIYPLGLNFIADKSRKPKSEQWSYLQREVHTLPNLIRYFAHGRGPIASIGALEGLAFIRTSRANDSLWDLPDIEIHFMAGCLSSDDGHIFYKRFGLNQDVWRQTFQPFVSTECFSLFPVLLKPRSRGWIKLASSDPYDEPLIDPRYLSHPEDIEVLADSMKQSLKIATSPPFQQRFGVKPSGRPVPGCEHLPIYSRPYMRCVARHLTATIYHPVGTCRMGRQDDPATVVDEKLRVKGIGSLRVADGSVMPEITSGNTNAPIIMIGEKAADLIKLTWTMNDVRFPTSLHGDGSDAMHTDPDYSCAYVRISVAGCVHQGHGHTFTIGRGTEIVVAAVRALIPFVMKRDFQWITVNWAQFWRELTSESQLRWIGPEKGAIHLATAAIVNALWDLWAKILEKPLWKMLVDMEPEELANVIDYRYITDAITKEEVIMMLADNRRHRNERESALLSDGYPAYTTGVGWTGYSPEKRRELCRGALSEGYTRFKSKVGTTIDEDRERLKIIREEIGDQYLLMVDANQKWDVDEAIEHMKQLADYKPLWIEEPTSPDDIYGHLKVSRALAPYGIGVATGEQCHNRVIFKQLLMSGAIQFCQIDACRVGGVNEVLAIIFMAHKFGVPVCPHAGGVGLCEFVQHLAMFDFVSLHGSTQGRMVEFIPHLSEHFHYPAVAIKGRYCAPTQPGYSGQMRTESIAKYSFPNGEYWKSVR